jgi:hypothetical protein
MCRNLQCVGFGWKVSFCLWTFHFYSAWISLPKGLVLRFLYYCMASFQYNGGGGNFHMFSFTCFFKLAMVQIVHP